LAFLTIKANHWTCTSHSEKLPLMWLRW